MIKDVLDFFREVKQTFKEAVTHSLPLPRGLNLIAFFL